MVPQTVPRRRAHSPDSVAMNIKKCTVQKYVHDHAHNYKNDSVAVDNSEDTTINQAIQRGHNHNSMRTRLRW